MLLLAVLAACAPADRTAAPGDFAVTPREPGARAPLTGACDDQDPLRCLLPFPNSRFLAADASRPTGLRVAIEASSLPGEGDDAAFLNAADGFSRVSPVMTGFNAHLDGAFLDGLAHGDALPAGAPIRLFEAEPGEGWAREIPVWAEVVNDGIEVRPEGLLIAYPLIPLRAGAEHLVVVTDGLRAADGAALPRSREAEVALGLVAPESAFEADLQGYHAPSLALLDEVGVEPASVLRVWDFTTRSEEGLTGRLDGMMAVVRGSLGDIGVEVDTVATTAEPAIAAIVLGRLTGVPTFLDADDNFVLDAAGVPQLTGTHEARFRVVIPANGWDGAPGSDWRVALYGHGTGGGIGDDSFDAEIAREGMAKVSLEFGAWNGDDLLTTFSRMMQLSRGTGQSTAMLQQSVVDGYAILTALGGPLGAALEAETLGGVPNPAAGRAVDLDNPVWVGGSLGGTMGAIIGSAYPEIRLGVLNVPAAGWTHLIPDSLMYQTAMKGVLVNNYGTELDARFAIALSQTNWDDVDGAVWADRATAEGDLFLLQESMGDPVVPNQGTHLLAAALRAPIVGPPLAPIAGVEQVDALVGRSGITQYRVPSTGVYDVHGFAARNTPAGLAAMEQIFHFVRTGSGGEAEILFPDGCATVTPDGTCDFSGMWSE